MSDPIKPNSMPNGPINFSLEERFEKLVIFLKQYTPVWNEEILFRYPEILKSYPKNWVDELAQMSQQDLYEFEMSLSPDRIKDLEFKEFIETINTLCLLDIKNLSSPLALPSYALMKIKEKKVHEVEAIISQIKDNSFFKNTEIIDLCGGKGLLSHCLQLSTGLPLTTVDKDPVLQSSGKDRWDKLECQKGTLKYLEKDLFSTDLNFQFSRQCFMMGLHTCGALSWCQIEHSFNPMVKGGLNFGCCYHRLKDHPPILRSKSALNSRINLDKAALTLASRGQYETITDYKFTYKVKSYRYMLHLFLQRELNKVEFLPLGNSPKKLYDEPFHVYALEQLKRLRLSSSMETQIRLEHFWKDDKNQQEMRYMYLANRIRNFLARPVELFILLDRAFYLKENGFDVEVSKWFDPKISPRNIGILYSRTN
jgi:hypothetical protein